MYMLGIGSRSAQRLRSEKLRKISELEGGASCLEEGKSVEPLAPSIAVSIGVQSRGLLALYEGISLLETIQKNLLLQKSIPSSLDFSGLQITDPKLRSLLHELEIRLWVLEAQKKEHLSSGPKD